MKFSCPHPQKKWITLLTAAALSTTATLALADAVDLGTVGGAAGAATNPTVYAEKGTAQAIAPTQSSLNATEPMSIISREFIVESTAPTGNYATIAAIAPSVAVMPSTNGPGMADQKIIMRGFTDGNFNITFDGIPFGDTNGPTHHSTAYFPASIVGSMVVERGPGNASNIGYATYGGSVNMYSKAPSATEKTSVYGSFGSWNTLVEGVSHETGHMEGSDATLQLDLQHMSTKGYTTYSGLQNNNFTLKYTRPVGDATLLTFFASLDDANSNVTDNASGVTVLQMQQGLGKNYAMNNNPNSQGYFGYNTVSKQTDMDYLRAQTGWGAGWETDNQLYTYAYKNNTFAGQDPSQYNPTTHSDTTLGFKNLLGRAATLPSSTDVYGYYKLNEYRVFGDLFKLTKQFDIGLLRTGFWFEGASTERHNLEADRSNNPTSAVLPGVTNTNGVTSGACATAALCTSPGVVSGSNFATQNSHYNQVQPFVEFEWAAAEGLTITPGFKTMSYHFGLDSAMNQIKNGQVPQAYNYTYTASLPFLTVRQKLDAQNTVYAQYAKGMDVPFLGVGSATSGTPAPQTTTNYQVGVVHVEDRLTVDADIYYIDVGNLQQSTGTGNAIQYYNAGGAVYKGWETEGTYVLGAGFSAYAAYSLNDSNYKTTNPGLTVGQDRITGTPNMTAGLGLLYKEGPWSGSLIYKRIGEQQYSYSATGMPTLAAFNNVGLNMAYTFKEAVAGIGLKSLRAQFSVFNLTNEQNVVTASGALNLPATQVTYEAPRSYMMTLKGEF